MLDSNLYRHTWKWKCSQDLFSKIHVWWVEQFWCHLKVEACNNIMAYGFIIIILLLTGFYWFIMIFSAEIKDTFQVLLSTFSIATIFSRTTFTFTFTFTFKFFPGPPGHRSRLCLWHGCSGFAKLCLPLIYCFYTKLKPTRQNKVKHWS